MSILEPLTLEKNWCSQANLTVSRAIHNFAENQTRNCSYHTCHIYHILCPDMTHMIGMTGVPQAKGLRVPIFLVG